MPQLNDIKRKNKNTPKSNQVGRGNGSKGTYSGRGSNCLLYTSPSPRDRTRSRMPSSA